MAGYGRREVAHCITNDQGPEAFEVCSRPMDCSYDHRTRSCGISFTYKVREKFFNFHHIQTNQSLFPKGEKYTSCIQGDTPSKNDRDCSKFRSENTDEKLKNVTIHLIQSDKITTCYPGNNIDYLNE